MVDARTLSKKMEVNLALICFYFTTTLHMLFGSSSSGLFFLCLLSFLLKSDKHKSVVESDDFANFKIYHFLLSRGLARDSITKNKSLL